MAEKGLSWRAGLVLTVAMIAALIGIKSCMGSGPYAADALSMCRQAIKAASANPSAAKIPSANNIGPEGGEFRFSWPHGSGLQLQNGYGAMIDTGATCSVSADGKRITFLFLNDEVLIGG